MAEGGKVWCEDPQKVPRKIPARAVHGADIRNSGGLGGKVTVEDDKKDAKTVRFIFESVAVHYPDSCMRVYAGARVGQNHLVPVYWDAFLYEGSTYKAVVWRLVHHLAGIGSFSEIYDFE